MTAAKSAVSTSSAHDENKPSGPVPVKPVTPRRGLFILCVVVFALWAAALIVMYFDTVYPHRHPTMSRPAESVESVSR